MTILGAVLAGGASSRFGSDKALAVVGGQTLLDHARGALAAVTDEVVVVGRAGGVPDLPAPGLGPLGGIAGALDHAARRGFESVLTVGCDMPDLPEELLEALVAEAAPAFCADAPVLGHWPATLAPALLAHLAAATPSSRPRAGIQSSADFPAVAPAQPGMPGRVPHDRGHAKNAALSVRRWAASIGAVAIPSPVAIRNVNTPADLPTP